VIGKITGLDVWAGEVTPMQFGRAHDGAGEPLDHTAVVIVLPDCLEYKNVFVRIEVAPSGTEEVL